MVIEPLLEVVRAEFEHRDARDPSAEQSPYRLRDCLGMALSVVVFKYPSLCHSMEELKVSSGLLGRYWRCR